MMLPYKMNNALLSSIQQAKIPPDMQGRVFGLLGQISIFAQTLGFISYRANRGSVVDSVVGVGECDGVVYNGMWDFALWDDTSGLFVADYP